MRILLLTLLLMLSGCAADGVAKPGATLDLPDVTLSYVNDDLYVSPLDMVAIDVFGVDDLDGTYQVDNLGRLSLPLIGSVQAAGKLPYQVAADVETRLARGFLKDPQVNIIITASQARRLTVDGSVNQPGLYPVSGKMSLLQAVAQAGGPTEGANPKMVAIFRTIDGQRQAAAFNLVAIRKGDADDPEVYGNDIIVVDGSEARRNYGELLRSIPLAAFFLAF